MFWTGGKFSAVLRNRITKWTSAAIKDNVVVLKISFPSLERHTVNQVVSYGFGNLLGKPGRGAGVHDIRLLYFEKQVAIMWSLLDQAKILSSRGTSPNFNKKFYWVTGHFLAAADTRYGRRRQTDWPVD